jgi:hypothetical protein
MLLSHTAWTNFSLLYYKSSTNPVKITFRLEGEAYSPYEAEAVKVGEDKIVLVCSFVYKCLKYLYSNFKLPLYLWHLQNI